MEDSTPHSQRLLEVQPINEALQPTENAQHAFDTIGAKVGDIVLLQAESTPPHNRVIEIAKNVEVMARESTGADKSVA